LDATTQTSLPTIYYDDHATLDYDNCGLRNSADTPEEERKRLEITAPMPGDPGARAWEEASDDEDEEEHPRTSLNGLRTSRTTCESVCMTCDMMATLPLNNGRVYT
jgi:hypothetical protein